MRVPNPVGVVSEATLRAQIEQIADQLCLTVGGQFDFLVSVDGEDETAEKLQMVTNFVLTTARRSIEEVQRVKDALQDELEERKRAERQIAYLQEEVDTAKALGPMVGKSLALKKVWQQVDMVAPTDASVLIVGESGTGKELVARAIHDRSARNDRPLVSVNCASIPRELFESEFFGHRKGAFTGAAQDRVGRFELADGGTLFLDEVAEIPQSLQSKLLRALQEGEFERVGENRTRKVDVRIVAATNRDLAREMDAERFRPDLYYRLNVFPIEVAPLRRRKQDIPLLATLFLDRASARLNLPPARLTPGNLRELEQYDWPGNVRELQNIIERAVITARGGALHFTLADDAGVRRGAGRMSDAEEVVSEREMKRRERANMMAALEQAGGKIYGPNGAATLLGVKPTTLAARLKTMGLKGATDS